MRVGSLTSPKSRLLVRLLFLGVLVCAALAVIGDFTGLASRWQPAWSLWFGLGEEKNVPAAYSTFLLAVPAALLLLIAFRVRRDGSEPVLPWLLLGVGFLVMAVDEFFSLHENLTLPTAQFLVSCGFSPGHFGPLAFAWVVPGLGLVVALGVFFQRFLVRLSRETRSRFLVAAGVYLSGVLLMEMVGAWYFESVGKIDGRYMALSQIEEVLEMSGMILFIRALLLEIQRRDSMEPEGSWPVAGR